MPAAQVVITATDKASGALDVISASFTVYPLPQVGTNHGSWGAVAAAASPLAAFRAYNPPSTGVPATWPGKDAQPVPSGVALPVISFWPPDVSGVQDIAGMIAGHYDTQLSAYAKLIPAGALVSCALEGEAGVNPWTAAQIRALHAHVYPLVKAGSPHCLYGQIVTCYTASKGSAHYPLGQWIAPGMDFYGLDGYQGSGGASAASVFGAAASAITAVQPGAVLAVTETNSPVQADRPAWFAAAWQWAIAERCLCFCAYFDGAGSGTSYEWVPGDTATISALAGISAAAA